MVSVFEPRLLTGQNLQSADEMEEEEKAAQSAKLQELIRRGSPQDLQEANRLMKVMAGYDTKHKTDYRAKAAEEVSKIQAKAKLLEERLQNFKAGDDIADGDIFEVGRIIRDGPALTLSGTGECFTKRTAEDSEDVRRGIRRSRGRREVVRDQ